MEKEVLTHGQLLLLSWLGNGALLGLTVGIISKMISNLKGYIENTCVLKHTNVESALKTLTEEDGKLWDAFNSHGHKGLTANNSKVTRQ